MFLNRDLFHERDIGVKEMGAINGVPCQGTELRGRAIWQREQIVRWSGEFTALVQAPGILVAGEAKIALLGPKFNPSSGASALLSMIVNGKPLRQNQLLARVQPPKTRSGPKWKGACRNTSTTTRLGLK
jgi:hypothetical protein